MALLPAELRCLGQFNPRPRAPVPAHHACLTCHLVCFGWGGCAMSSVGIQKLWRGLHAESVECLLSALLDLTFQAGD